ncbi:serine/threonine-protein kinase 16-like isoform X2 [Symsagittifera roscoffensis]
MVDKSSREKKLYAVKRILTRTVEDEKAVLEEVKFHRLINHPNLIKLVDSTVINPSSSQAEYFLVLPFFKNGSLEDALKANQIHGTRLSHLKVLKLFAGICSGVDYLHRHESGAICHRDLKCANILMTGKDSGPVIMDFGSMTTAPIHVTNRTQAMTIQDDAAEKCSILYRAPELFNVEVGSVIDTAIDIWSLGCILFALMYFENPFEKCFTRGDSVALAAMGCNVRIPKESEFPAFLNDLIFVLMAVEPSNRPCAATVLQQIRSHQEQIKSTRNSGENISNSNGQGSSKVIVERTEFVSFEKGDIV